MALEDVKEALKKMQSIIPFLLMSGAFNSLFLSFLMILPGLIEIYEYLKEIFFQGRPLTVFKIYDSNDYGDGNFIYNVVTFLIFEHNLINNGHKFENKESCITGKTFTIGTNYPKNIRSQRPLIMLSPGFHVYFTTKMFNVVITSGVDVHEKQKRRVNFYSISANSKQEIDAFIKYIEEFQQIYCAKNYSGNEDNLAILRFKEKAWVPSSITVKKSFKNIFLDRTTMRTFKHQLRTFMKSRELYEKLGMAYKIGYLLYGAPGNGKTSTIIAVANEFNRNVYQIDLEKIDNDDLISQVKSIPANSVVIFEDIDTYDVSHSRTPSEISQKEEKEKTDNPLAALIKKPNNLGKLLEVLDGYCYLHGCIIFMTSNHPEKLDAALIRPGRIDHRIEFKNASAEQIRQIIKYFFDEEYSEEIALDISVSEFINTLVIPHLGDFCSLREQMLLVADHVLRT